MQRFAAEPATGEVGQGVAVDDAELFDRLYADFALRVRGLVRRLIADGELVEDIVQETFLRAYGARLHLEYLDAQADRSQWPWLAAVARNRALDALRKHRGFVEQELDDEVVLTERSLGDPETHHLAARRREGIATALQAVCPRQRRMLILKHVEGWRYERIAESEGISIEALKSALARARRTFRSAYADIAEHSGLGVVVAGLTHRVASRVRALRDRVLNAVPDGVMNALSAAPGSVTAVMTVTLLGVVAVAGPLFDGRTAIADVPTADGRIVHSSDAAPAQMPRPVVMTSVSDSEGVAASAERATVAQTETAPAVAGGGSGSETSASVDTDDIIPVADPPASASAGGSLSKDDDEASFERQADVGLGDNGGSAGGNDSGAGSDGGLGAGYEGETGIDCPPPEERGKVTTVPCAVLDALP